MKLLFIDVETTGVRYWKNGIHQISGCVEIDGTVTETFNFKVKPYAKALVEAEALAVGGITPEDLEDYADMKDVYDELLSIFGRYVNKYDKKDKFFMVGFNCAAFDNNFFRAFFVQMNDTYFGSWIWSSTLDVMVLAAAKLINERPLMENFQLKTVAKQLGITVDETKLHDALYDIELTRSIYQLCIAA